MRMVSIWFVGMIGLAAVVSAATAVGDETGVVTFDPYAARKVFYEDLWKSKISAALQYVDGAVVCVDVKVSPQVARTVVSKEYGAEPVAEIKTTKVTDQAEEETGSRGDGKKSTASESIYTKNLISESQVTTEIAGLTPEEVSVTVSVPRLYYANALASRIQTGIGEHGEDGDRRKELLAIEREVTAQIEATVGTLLPGGKAEDARVRVVSFDAFAEAVEAAPRLERAAKVKHPEVITVVFGGEVAGKQKGVRQASATGEDTFRMAALVKGANADGELQIEGHQVTTIGEEEWRRDMSGRVRAEVVRLHDGQVPADEVADLRLRTLCVRVEAEAK